MTSFDITYVKRQLVTETELSPETLLVTSPFLFNEAQCHTGEGHSLLLYESTDRLEKTTKIFDQLFCIREMSLIHLPLFLLSVREFFLSVVWKAQPLILK